MMFTSKASKMQVSSISVLGFAVIAAIVISMTACDDGGGEHEHKWGAWQTITAATCVSKGSEKRTCTLDASHTETQVTDINPNAHNWSDWDAEIEPTCTTEGKGSRTCANDHSHDQKNVEIPALRHNWGIWIRDDTGITETRTCSRDAFTETRGLTFNSVEAFSEWLDGLPTNTAATAYTVKVNVSDLGGDYNTAGSLGNSLYKYTNTGYYRYVNLDLSGSTITTIVDYAFYNCISLAGITIPNSVTSIGNQAFSYCQTLTDITIPNSVTSIGNGAFSSCNKLTEINVLAANSEYTSEGGVLYNKTKTVLHTYPYGKTGDSFTIPDSVTSIGDNAFIYCRLTGVTIPNSVTSIGQEAFFNSSLASVTIGNNVASIGNNAFAYCFNLTSITIPSSVTSIGNGVFAGCSILTGINVDAGNSAYSSEDGVLYNKTKTVLHAYPRGKTDDSFTIPNGVTTIGEQAFSSCTSLTDITIPNSVTSIGYNAFGQCTGLTDITIPNSVTYIGSFAFYYCTSLADVTIGSGVTSIDGYAFYYCTSLADVTIGSGVTRINYYAFYNTGLTEVTIPSSVTRIDYNAFSNCTKLTSVTFEGTISYFDSSSPFDGDLRAKYLAGDGGIGTYTRDENGTVWTKE